MTRRRRGTRLLIGSSVLALSSCLIDELPYDPNITPGQVGLLARPPSEACIQYCDAVQANCTGNFQVYLNTSDCLKICAALPSGEDLLDPMGTNTVACRLSSARSATREKNTYCSAASAEGGDICGSSCQAYCSLRMSICPGVNVDDDVAACETKCAILLEEDFRPNPLATGDTLQCRINHLINASQSSADAEAHCWHTSLGPDQERQMASPCAEPADTPGDCQRYCQLVMFSCNGADEVYENEAQCLEACKVHPLGLTSQVGGQAGDNTIGCRTYHAYSALDLGRGGPTTHCSHAGPLGDGHCGTRPTNNCQSYCRVLKRACTPQFFAEYLPGSAVPPSLPDNPTSDELGTCEATCARELGALGAGPDSRYSIATAPDVNPGDDMSPGGDKGDVLQCRTYHAVRALTTRDPGDCERALGRSGCN